MAKLSAHGMEVARIKKPGADYSVRSDGHVLRRLRHTTGEAEGWKLWRRAKPGTDLMALARALERM